MHQQDHEPRPLVITHNSKPELARAIPLESERLSLYAAEQDLPLNAYAYVSGKNSARV
jgi:hypothetical protein